VWRKIYFKYLVIFSIITICFCQSDKTYRIEHVGGIKHIHNLGPKFKSRKASLKLIQRIGDDEKAILNKPLGITSDYHGNLYINDEGDNNIKKYDADGNHLATFGRRGQGPGEFEYVMRLLTDKQDHLYVYQLDRRMQILSLEGEYLDEFRMPLRGTNLILLNDQEFMVNATRMEEDEPPLLQIVDRTGNIINEFCKPHHYEPIDAMNRGNTIYFCMDSLRYVYVAFRSQNRIEKYNSNGELIFRMDRPLNFKIFLKKSGDREFDFGNRKVKFPEYDMSHVSRGIGIDHKERIWILTHIRQFVVDDTWEDLFEFEIYDTDGIMLFKADCPNIRFDNFKIIGNRIYFNDPYEVGCVHVYEIVDL